MYAARRGEATGPSFRVLPVFPGECRRLISRPLGAPANELRDVISSFKNPPAFADNCSEDCLLRFRQLRRRLSTLFASGFALAVCWRVAAGRGDDLFVVESIVPFARLLRCSFVILINDWDSSRAFTV